eukprot:CAMPEP_0171475854 /NCGR_PEP_ID=MMETSP0946-20130122/3241_1 /TAXON_ID=109269 /ORGANISM="Vaucheria litorea, Strain CCMP2940" /LENGTH=255 /DNA_ID=CAMNT_0012006001 /DNA_START=10 /DNA_END=774 /DNA_ORIENTATION=-
MADNAADNGGLKIAIRKSTNSCNGFGVLIDAMNTIDFPNEVQPIVEQIVKTAYDLKTIHLVELESFARSLKSFSEYFIFDKDDFESFYENIPEAAKDFFKLKKSCEELQKIFSQLHEELIDMGMEAREIEYEAKDRKSKAEGTISNAIITKKESSLRSTTILKGVSKFFSSVAEVAPEISGIPTIIRTIRNIVDFGSTIWQYNKASKEIKEIADGEIEKGNVSEIVNCLQDTVIKCIESLSNEAIHSFSYQMNIW